MTEKYNIEGMTCNGCRTRIEKALKEIDENVVVELETHSAQVDSSIERDVVIKTIENIGYKVI